MSLIIPKQYKSILDPLQTVVTIQKVKNFFIEKLSSSLNLQKIPAPLLIDEFSGISDNTTNLCPPVRFRVDGLLDRNIEIIRSITKWKRKIVSDLKMLPGDGIYSEIIGIRPDEELSNIHSLQVDQWDWELVISDDQRNSKYLKEVVEKIYNNIVETEKFVAGLIPEITPVLPDEITFITSEELLMEYPESNPYERELLASKKFGSIFIIGIGHQLSNGERHGYRTADYDDWSTENEEGFYGLNGDLIIWDPVLKQQMELSSMGIRVDKGSLLKQVEILNCPDILNLEWQKRLLNDDLVLTIGGGIGVSRLCMYMLRKAHIGEVQPAIWSNSMVQECKKHGIHFL